MWWRAINFVNSYRVTTRNPRVWAGCMAVGLGIETAISPVPPLHFPLFRAPAWKNFFLTRLLGGLLFTQHPFMDGNFQWSHNCKPCFPDSGWRRSLLSARLSGPRRLPFTCSGRLRLYFEASPMAVRLNLCSAPEVPLIFQRAPFGVCGLLAMPNIYQILGDNAVAYPCLVCVMRPAFSPPENRMWRACYWRSRWSCSSRTVSWGTQWGQLNGLLAAFVHYVPSL